MIIRLPRFLESKVESPVNRDKAKYRTAAILLAIVVMFFIFSFLGH
jgi:hypothetical protein